MGRIALCGALGLFGVVSNCARSVHDTDELPPLIDEDASAEGSAGEAGHGVGGTGGTEGDATSEGGGMAGAGASSGGKAARELAEEAEEPRGELEEPRGELGEPQEALEELRGGAVAPHPLVRRRANNVGARSAVTLNARFGDYRWGISRGVVPTRLLEFVA